MTQNDKIHETYVMVRDQHHTLYDPVTGLLKRFTLVEERQFQCSKKKEKDYKIAVVTASIISPLILKIIEAFISKS